jgi:nucleoside-diphosphate-sugar epimerase
MLKSAASVPSVRRVVITSSIVAIVSEEKMEKGDTTTIYTAKTRVRPLPQAPYQTARQSYRAAKILALDAADNFIAEAEPSFSVVHVLPGYVFGANELVTDAKSVVSGSNAFVMGTILGTKAPSAIPGAVVHLDDVARIHVGALDEKKVPASTNFLVSIPAQFDDALEIAKRLFPEAVEDGRLPLGGSMPTLPLTVDVQPTIDVFGPLKSYEEMVKGVVGQYLKLLVKG